VLGIVASTVSLYDVADAFQNWYDAYQAAQSAQRTWQMTVENNAPATTQQLYEYEYRQAYQRQEDAKAAVAGATHSSYWALGGAAIACGAAALAPTP
jgi:hypothetical protein